MRAIRLKLSTFNFGKIAKCGIYGYNCIIIGSLTKNRMIELRQNFILDELQLHTSTRTELNLIKSVIYIIFTFYLYLYFKHYLLQFYNK